MFESSPFFPPGSLSPAAFQSLPQSALVRLQALCVGMLFIHIFSPCSSFQPRPCPNIPQYLLPVDIDCELSGTDELFSSACLLCSAVSSLHPFCYIRGHFSVCCPLNIYWLVCSIPFLFLCPFGLLPVFVLCCRLRASEWEAKRETRSCLQPEVSNLFCLSGGQVLRSKC